ncbi:MAG: Dihydrofolate synthase [Deltaproteobacteria bacterium]|nr:Dihydrofolate synthase [Deltaproteobacteria bacterium]
MTGGVKPSGPESVRPGLSRILSAFSRSGNPERAFRTLHIAGTNGKGSTACFAFDVLRRLPVGPLGLFTSPHLVSPEERIRVDGTKISPRALRDGFRSAERLSPEGDPMTWFEAMTWTACDWFRRKGARFVVMEAGLGGRWDATSACRAAVSVITTVGIDHREWLGKTLGRIAGEKAGILRRGVPLVTGRLRPAARAVVLRQAVRLGCDAWELGRTFDWTEHRDGAIAISLPGVSLDGIRVGMAGRFQRDNAAVALAAAWRLSSGEGIGPDAFTAAAAKAIPVSRWPGRFCPVPLRKNAGAWVDGGHNPDAASALAVEIANVPPWGKGRRLVALWSMLADKDASGYLRELARHLDGIVTYPLSHPRGAEISALAAACGKRGIAFRRAGNFPEAWRDARRWAGERGVVLVCGSLAAAGDAYRHRVGFVP